MNDLLPYWPSHLPDPTRMQLDAASYLVHGPDKIVLLCHRAFGKTTLCDSIRGELGSIEEAMERGHQDGRARAIGTDNRYEYLEHLGYEVRVYPALYPDPSQLEVYGDRIAPVIREDLEKDSSLTGHAIRQPLWGTEELDQHRQQVGETIFLSQMMLLPSLSLA